VLKCKEEAKQTAQTSKQNNFAQTNTNFNKTLQQSNKKANNYSYVEEKHSQLKQDPKSTLVLLRPKNEEAEKEKFKYYWQNFATRQKAYNPRF